MKSIEVHISLSEYPKKTLLHCKWALEQQEGGAA